MFDIVNRIKRIDKGYFIVFDTKTNKYEVHNRNQTDNTYCLTSPYISLDKRLIDYVYRTSLQYNSNLIKEIEEHNARLEKDSIDKQQNYIESNLKDIYKIANSSSRNYDIGNSLNNVWL